MSFVIGPHNTEGAKSDKGSTGSDAHPSSFETTDKYSSPVA